MLSWSLINKSSVSCSSPSSPFTTHLLFNNVLYFLILCRLKINLINVLFCFKKLLIILFSFFLNFSSCFKNMLFIILFYVFWFVSSLIVRSKSLSRSGLVSSSKKSNVSLICIFCANFSLLLFYWFSKNKSTIQALISAQISVGAENSETQELSSEDRLIIVKFF